MSVYKTAFGKTCAGIIAAMMATGFVALATAGTIVESFSNNPAGRGWQTVGDASLFNWNASAGNLKVTWDSGKTNSFFRKSLGSILDKSDDFAVGFDLYLEDIAVGVRPGKAFTFELAAGFHNSISVTNQAFYRGVARQAPNLVEFDYFPDSGYGATVWPAFCATNGVMFFDYANPDRSYTIMEIPTGVWLRITMDYRGTNRTLHTSITSGGKSIGPITSVQLGTNFGDYRVDMFSITSYSDQNAGGSLLAHGIIDNIAVTVPDPPVERIAMNALAQSGTIAVAGKSNWLYQVEQSADLIHWSPASSAMPGTGNLLQFTVDMEALPAAYYRIKSLKP